MKADLTRTTFNPLKHFSRVARCSRGACSSMPTGTSRSPSCSISCGGSRPTSFGPAGGPADNLGFGLDLLDPAIASNAADFVIGAGHYYVDGILCEVDAAWLPVTIADTKTKVQLGRPARSMDGRLRPNQYVVLADCRSGLEGRAGAGANHRYRLRRAHVSR